VYTFFWPLALALALALGRITLITLVFLALVLLVIHMLIVVVVVIGGINYIGVAAGGHWKVVNLLLPRLLWLLGFRVDWALTGDSGLLTGGSCLDWGYQTVCLVDLVLIRDIGH
jgi:hypothetical protein